MRHEWFTVVLADISVRSNAGLAPKIPRKLSTLVILDYDDSFAPGKQTADLVRVQRENPFDRQLIGHDPFFARESLDGLTNYTFSGAPSHQGYLGVLGTDQLR